MLLTQEDSITMLSTIPTLIWTHIKEDKLWNLLSMRSLEAIEDEVLEMEEVQTEEVQVVQTEETTHSQVLE